MGTGAVIVVAAERLSARCHLGGRVSEPAGEGRPPGGHSDGHTTWGFEDIVAQDLPPVRVCTGSSALSPTGLSFLGRCL